MLSRWERLLPIYSQRGSITDWNNVIAEEHVLHIHPYPWLVCVTQRSFLYFLSL